MTAEALTAYCPTCAAMVPVVVASSDLERGARETTCWYSCARCKTAVDSAYDAGEPDEGDPPDPRDR